MSLPITLDPADTQPLYLQIADRLRTAVAAGLLAPGARLPSARGLANQLAVARGTVDAAYALLAGEGAIESRGSAGTVIAPHLSARVAPPEQRTMSFRTEGAAPPAPLPFRMGLPALDAFPRKLWSGLTVRAARAPGHRRPGLSRPGRLPAAPPGARRLSGRCARHCLPAEQILVTAGFQGALALVRHVLLRPGDTVWVEDPGYPNARQALEAAGARLVPVRVDARGDARAGGGDRRAAGTPRCGHSRPSMPAGCRPVAAAPAGVARLGGAKPAPGCWRTTTTASSATSGARWPR